MGKDDMASQLWAAATAKQCNGPRSARAAFGSLYRKGKHAALLDAWARLEVPTVLEGDMLWSSLGPSLGEGTSDATLSALSEAITPGAVVQRTLRLAPIMGRRYGVGSEIALLDRGLAMATTARQRQVLSNVRKRSGG
jgi:hypothetical protein